MKYRIAISDLRSMIRFLKGSMLTIFSILVLSFLLLQFNLVGTFRAPFYFFLICSIILLPIMIIVALKRYSAKESVSVSQMGIITKFKGIIEFRNIQNIEVKQHGRGYESLVLHLQNDQELVLGPVNIYSREAIQNYNEVKLLVKKHYNRR